MLVFLLIAAYLATWYIALGELKRTNPKEFERLGGDKVYFWPPSQQTAQAYFLVCSYFQTWSTLEKFKWSFILNTVLGWTCLIWLVFYFYGLLIGNT